MTKQGTAGTVFGQRVNRGLGFASVALLVLTLSGCSGDSATTPTPPPPPTEPVVTTVSLSASSLSFSSLGETAQLNATVSDQNGNTMSGQQVTWTSSSTETVTVSTSGLVTAAGNGAATVTASVGSKSATTSVQVAQVAQTIGLSADSVRLSAIGDTVRVFAEVRDARSNLIDGANVTWSSSDTTAAVVSETGLITAVSNGPTRVTGAVADLSSSLSVLVDDGGVWVEAVGEGTALEGTELMIVGRGFSENASENLVRFENRPARVLSSSPTELRVEVPAARCLPPRTEVVSVQVGESSDRNLAAVTRLGASHYESEPLDIFYTVSGEGCLDLPAAGEYLIGVTSTLEVPSALTPISFRTTAGDLIALPSAPAFGPMARASALSTQRVDFGFEFQPSPARTRNRQPNRLSGELESQLEHGRHVDWIAEMDRLLTELGRPSLDELRAADSPLRSGAFVAGDTIPLRFGSDGGCSQYDDVSGLVRHVGDKTVWIEDLDNTNLDWVTNEELAAWDSLFTFGIDPVLTEYVSDDEDIDGNGRTLIFLSERVNPIASAFVWGGDLYPRRSCAWSNQAEIFYSYVPDSTRSVQSVKDRMPMLLAHEITHIRHNTIRILRPGTVRKTVWEIEGGATLMEALVGHSQYGNSARSNLSFEAFRDGFQLYQSMPFALSVFLGSLGDTQVENAPHECSWLGRPSDGAAGPCTVGEAFLPYGAPSVLLQLMIDEFGGLEATTQQAVMRRLGRGPFVGLENLVQAASEFSGRAWTVEELLMRFYSALWLDDRPIDGSSVDALPSWNLFDVMSGMGYLYEAPESRAPEPTFPANIRGASNRYLHWVPGDDATPSSVLMTSTNDPASETPENVFVWAIRLR